MALDVTAVRKLGVPFQPELAMGAIEEGGIRTIHQDVVSMTGVTSNDLAAAERREQVDLKRRFQRSVGSPLGRHATLPEFRAHRESYWRYRSLHRAHSESADGMRIT